ncbi:GntR family transcriptional regulator [Flavobacteriaceae bacterium GF1]
MSKPTILRDSVKDHLLHLIRQGEIEIGKTINLAALSRTLNISVTPIREALTQLEQSRILKAVPNRGFIVPKLSLTEAENLYRTIADLEVLAVEGTVYDEQLVKELRNEQLHLQQTHTPSARLASRVNFHRILIKNCPNTILTEILHDLESRVLFYEQMFVLDASFYEHIDNQNEAIIRAIEEDNVPTAALILNMNWMTVLEYVQKQLVLQQSTNYEVVSLSVLKQ